MVGAAGSSSRASEGSEALEAVALAVADLSAVAVMLSLAVAAGGSEPGELPLLVGGQ